MIRKLKWLCAPVVAMAMLGGLLAGCGGSSSTTGESSSKTEEPTAGGESSTTSNSSEPWVKTALDYTGGPGGQADAAKSPVKIGYVNTEGGPELSWPEGTKALNATVEFINEDLGGIHGHPLEVVECLITSTNEQTQNCAQQMANDQSLVGVLMGKLAYGSPIFYSTMNGSRPILTLWPGPDLASVNAKNNYAFTAGLFGSAPGMAKTASEVLHATSVSLLSDTSGTSQASAKEITDILEAEGVEVTLGSYSPNEADLTSAVVASKAQSTDVTILRVPDPSFCSKGFKALQGIGFDKPLVTISTCATPELESELANFPTVYDVENFENRDVSNPVADASNEILANYGSVDLAAEAAGGLSQGVSGAMIAARLLNEVADEGEVTPAGFENALKSFTGPGWLSPEPLKWGSVDGMANLGARAVQVYKFENEEWSSADGNKWLNVG